MQMDIFHKMQVVMIFSNAAVITAVLFAEILKVDGICVIIIASYDTYVPVGPTVPLGEDSYECLQ